MREAGCCALPLPPPHHLCKYHIPPQTKGDLLTCVLSSVCMLVAWVQVMLSLMETHSKNEAMLLNIQVGSRPSSPPPASPSLLHDTWLCDMLRPPARQLCPLARQSLPSSRLCTLSECPHVPPLPFHPPPPHLTTHRSAAAFCSIGSAGWGRGRGGGKNQCPRPVHDDGLELA